MELYSFFIEPKKTAHKRYEALRMYYVEGATAREVADRFGYSYRAMTSLITWFHKKLDKYPTGSFFFVASKPGRKVGANTNQAKAIIINLRKKYYSVPDIKVVLDAVGHSVSEKNIYNILSAEGFSRLPRRAKMVRQQLEQVQLPAEKSCPLTFEREIFKSSNAGVLMFLPLIKRYHLDTIINKSDYPGTSKVDKMASILSFLALKLSNRRRHSSDDTWCMDRGMGLFAGLNVLPKAAWYTSYSDRVTSDMNRSFLKQLHKIWLKSGLLEDTSNLDFTTIPYWGNDDHLENNWSGKRGKALGSMLAVLAHDPDSGLIDYEHTRVVQKEENDVVLEFLDFYRNNQKKGDHPLRYIIFDNQFANYENLKKLDQSDIKFITIRRRGKLILGRISNLPTAGWKIIRKYARRWNVEKTISEQIEFFHLNLVSSSMVIKVDFDLTMSVFAHNLYRLFALELERYSNLSVQSLYDKFVLNGADIEISEKNITVKLKKKRNLPLILEVMPKFSKLKYPWLNNKQIIFEGASYS